MLLHASRPVAAGLPVKYVGSGSVNATTRRCGRSTLSAPAPNQKAEPTPPNIPAMRVGVLSTTALGLTLAAAAMSVGSSGIPPASRRAHSRHRRRIQSGISVALGVRLRVEYVLSEPLPPPEMKREGQDIVFTWAIEGAQITVKDITITGRDGPRAEVWARDTTVGHLHVGMMNLLSTTSKHTFIKAVIARAPGTNWSDAVEQACVLAVEEHREGESLQLLVPEFREGGRDYAVAPLVPMGLPTLLFGDGGCGKSYLSLAIARAIALGEPLAGMTAAEYRPAYLDWEWGEEEHAERLYRLGGGDITLLYQACRTSLVSQVRALGRKLDKEEVNFLIIDSLGLAAGGDPREPDVVLSFFGALRELGRTALVVHHVPKDSKEPYGSVYIRNSVRSAWYMVRSQARNNGEFLAALRHRKTNFSGFEKDIGLRFRFTEDRTEIESTDARSVPELSDGSPLRQRIYDLLDGAEPQAANDIAVALDVPASQVSVRLSEMKRSETVVNVSGAWALRSQREEV